MFDWPGTSDPTAWLSTGDALDFMAGLSAEGWAGVRARNRDLALRGRGLLCEALGIGAPAPASMIGSIAGVPLPAGGPASEESLFFGDPLQRALLERHGIEAPVNPWPSAPDRVLRISAQVYNTTDEYARLADALREELDGGS
jgi:isopenicillin-N epimerase